MRTLTRRLGRVAVVAQRQRQAASPRYDVSDLSSRECFELDTLLARAGGARPTEEWAKAPLTPEEEARLVVLAARVRVVEPDAR